MLAKPEGLPFMVRLDSIQVEAFRIAIVSPRQDGYEDNCCPVGKIHPIYCQLGISVLIMRASISNFRLTDTDMKRI
jgi:hypothetical protein